MKSRDELGRFIKGHNTPRKNVKSGPENPQWRRVEKDCSQCGKTIYVKRCRLKAKNYCSRTCASIGFRGNIPWNFGTAKTSTENELFRKSRPYKEWREKVFERDDYTCQECGTRGGQLHADHIKPFAIFKKDRLKLKNGRTLCVDCHIKTPTYGYKVNLMKKQYEKA